LESRLDQHIRRILMRTHIHTLVIRIHMHTVIRTRMDPTCIRTLAITAAGAGGADVGVTAATHMGIAADMVITAGAGTLGAAMPA
jgi:hypothetical protein